jgi:CelD/BcsL family acetyltransferase involved in cellulose biosynthesis
MTSDTAMAIISDRREFAALETEWWALWRRVPSATPFQSPAWLLPWWEAFAPGELHVATVRRDQQLIGLAPFYLERSGGRQPRILPIGISISDYLDVLVDPGAAASLSATMAGSSAWQSWELPELSHEAQALALPCPPGCEEALTSGETCPYIALPSEPGELVSTLPQRKRRSLSLDRNRTKRRGEVTFHSLADCPAEHLLNELFRLHGLRWESRNEPGVLADPRVQRFHRMAVPRLVAAGLARFYGIRIAGRVAAVYYGMRHGTHAYAYLNGLDPDFAYESPGTLLMAHAMREAVAEGAREFHFLRGGEAYKYGWGAVDRWNQRRVFTRREADAAA